MGIDFSHVLPTFTHPLIQYNYNNFVIRTPAGRTNQCRALVPKRRIIWQSDTEVKTYITFFCDKN
jgi:hypothetical protein